MSKSTEFLMRVDGKAYLGLPDAHRTTFVVGMIDMLEKMLSYAPPQVQIRFNAMRTYALPLTGAELCQLLDDYLNADSARGQYAAASSFIVALGEKCVA